MNSSIMILPPPIKPGDCIGLFHPAGPVLDQERFDSGIQLLHELGFCTKQYPPVSSAPHQYLAAEDSTRAEEFHTMWADHEIHAMLAVRGGYGCLRMMPFLDLNILRENPKLVIGFSDLTVLLNSIANHSSIVALHGPVLTSLASSDTESIASFVTQITENIQTTHKYNGIEILRGGFGTGTIRGGNLTTIAHLLGTPWEIPCQNTILILEDTGEPMYKIDRILTQLFISGRLNQLAGLILGSFDYSADEESNLKLQNDVWNRVLELTANTDYPVWSNFPFGHLSRNHTIPIGVTGTMNSASGEITIEANNDNSR